MFTKPGRVILFLFFGIIHVLYLQTMASNVKKDVHPSVRNEWKRLHDAHKNEKERPENAGCRVYLDYRERKLYRDGVVIDTWSLQSF